MKLKSVLAGAIGALSLVTAQAATYDFGLHDSTELSFPAGGGFVMPGAFADIYTFSLGASQLVSSTVVSNNGPSLNIFASLYALYSAGSDTLFGTSDDSLVAPAWSFNGSTGNTVHTVSLDAGSYYYVVSGISNGQAGGVYVLSSTTTAPVPEPETYAMLLAGLAAIGFVAQRRKNAA